MSAPSSDHRLVAAPRLAAPSGSVAYSLPGVGFVWDYRDWTGLAHAKPRWGAAYKPDPHARCALVNRLGFRSRSAALSWLAAQADPLTARAKAHPAVFSAPTTDGITAAGASATVTARNVQADDPAPAVPQRTDQPGEVA